MELLRTLPIVLAVASLAVACPAVQAQSPATTSTMYLKIKPLRQTQPPMPFPPNSETPGRVKTIEFRTPEQMTQKDRDLEADGEAAIRERAGFEGLEFNDGKWSYKQIVCPALPNHLFLEFTRNNGDRDVSLFSASIPRVGSDGRVRIIPILRRGYSLFSPAPINALTISAFNHIRAEEHPDKAPDWLTTGLCYAALAGAHPVAALLAENTADQKFPAAMPAVMEIPNQGGAVIRFADTAARPHPMEWTMTFDGKGKLLKAAHAPADMVREKATKQTVVEAKGKRLPQIIVDAQGKPIAPVDANPATKPIPQASIEKGRPVPQGATELQGKPAQPVAIADEGGSNK
jgi:hypothetical protein